eukprot:Skav207366  [mRNA]  locus=scaffold3618:11792:13757:- [translate_table: standard]
MAVSKRQLLAAGVATAVAAPLFVAPGVSTAPVAVPRAAARGGSSGGSPGHQQQHGPGVRRGIDHAGRLSSSRGTTQGEGRCGLPGGGDVSAAGHGAYELAPEFKGKMKILMDTRGPEIRTGTFEVYNSKKELKAAAGCWGVWSYQEWCNHGATTCGGTQ